ncbi:MAG: 5-bromo-4-chloroindolyl phosphate hydrolysis family protein [Peptococcaceae bacterium]|nr:5-bromo-4-chloroindolyl phosphate hydrolysis family protein [Peptococcaceae bacterium]
MSDQNGFDAKALRRVYHSLKVLQNLQGVDKDFTALKDFGNTLKDAFVTQSNKASHTSSAFSQHSTSQSSPSGATPPGTTPGATPPGTTPGAAPPGSPTPPYTRIPYTAPRAPNATPPYATPPATYPRRHPVPVPVNGPSKWAGLPSIIIGTAGLTLFGITAATMGLISLFSGWSWSVILFYFFLILEVPCLWLWISGKRKRSFSQRVRRILGLLQAKNTRPLEELTTLIGLPPERIKKDIRQATHQNMISNVHLDSHETCLIYGPEAYNLYLEVERRHRDTLATERELLTQMSGTELTELKKFSSEGATALQRIRKCNDELASPTISAELKKLEESTGKIISYVESHPGKLPDVRKFVDYYLPTTLKLTDKYLEFEKTDADTARQAQREIETALSGIDKAFRNLLDKLTEEDAMDVSTDITVLQTMLAQEGLTDDKFDIRKGEKP